MILSPYDRKPLHVTSISADEVLAAWILEDPDVMPLFVQPEIGTATLRWDDETEPSALIVWDGQSTYWLALYADNLLVHFPDDHYEGTAASTFATLYDPTPEP